MNNNCETRLKYRRKSFLIKNLHQRKTTPEKDANKAIQTQTNQDSVNTSTVS